MSRYEEDLPEYPPVGPFKDDGSHLRLARTRWEGAKVRITVELPGRPSMTTMHLLDSRVLEGLTRPNHEQRTAGHRRLDAGAYHAYVMALERWEMARTTLASLVAGGSASTPLGGDMNEYDENECVQVLRRLQGVRARSPSDGVDVAVLDEATEILLATMRHMLRVEEELLRVQRHAVAEAESEFFFGDGKLSEDRLDRLSRALRYSS